MGRRGNPLWISANYSEIATPVCALVRNDNGTLLIFRTLEVH